MLRVPRYVFQGSLRDQLLYPTWRHVEKERLEEVLRSVRLHDLLEHGLEAGL